MDLARFLRAASRWRLMFTLSAKTLVATAILLGAYSGQSAAQTTGPIQAIAAGDQHALAITNFSSTSGLLWAWGANWNGQVGDGAQYYSRFPPTHVMAGSEPGDFTGATAIGGGENFSLAVRNDGTVWAWGNNHDGQLGVHSNNDHDSPQQVHGPGNVGYLTGATAVAAGDSFSLALMSNGTVYAWGSNGYGQLGHEPSYDDIYIPFGTPVQVPGLTDVLAIAAGPGGDFALAVKKDGTVWAWGDGGCGQLGVNSNNNHAPPVQVHGLGNVGHLTGIVGVAAGQGYSLAVGGDGSVYAWGCGGDGRLGVNSNNDHFYPQQVHGLGNVGYLTGILHVAAGAGQSLAVDSDGNVYAWGNNNHGQLGVHSHNDHFYPQQVHGLGNVGYLSDIAEVAAGQFFSMALKNDGTAVYAWGGNSYNQIDGTGKDRSYPVLVTGLPSASQEPTGPEVTQVVPAAGAVNVVRGRPVVATFSAKMDEASIKMPGTFTLVKEGITPVEAKVTYNAATKKATLNPVRPLEKGVTYTATVSTQAKDQAGNALREPMIWSFTVRG